MGVSDSDIQLTAVIARQSTLQLLENYFLRNRADFNGGAIHLDRSIFNTSSSRFLLNSAGLKGGAIFADGSFINLTNSTFVLNKGNISGAAIFTNNSQIYQDESVQIRNTFVANNNVLKRGEPPVHRVNNVPKREPLVHRASKVVGSIFSTTMNAYTEGLMFPMLSEAITSSPIVVYYSKSGGGYVSIIMALNETTIILTDAEEKYMLYSLKPPQVLSFIDRSKPTSTMSASIYSFLNAIITRSFFTNLGAAINRHCSSCNLRFHMESGILQTTSLHG